MSHSQMKRVTYKCQCGHVVGQDNYLPEEAVIPVQPCVKCRKGFGMDIAQQIQAGVGLRQVTEAELYTL